MVSPAERQEDQHSVIDDTIRGGAAARQKGDAAVPTEAMLPQKAVSCCGDAQEHEGSEGSEGETASTTASTVSSTPGSGWGGIRTPVDDFIDRRRKSSWCRPPSRSLQASPALPPRVYVDNRTLIREVHDFSTLRRGDHCLIAINIFRAMTPSMDYLISALGSIEICYLYHHFIVVDDVDHIDEHGIPRRADGEMAMIVEWGNTIPEACHEINTTAGGSLRNLPFVATRFFFTGKAKFTKHPLADYGDTPHIYLRLAKQTPEERERTVNQALRMHDNVKSRYNVFFNNCEHACHEIRHGSHSSAQISFMLWTTLRLMLGLLGLLLLRWTDCIGFAGACFSTLWLSHPTLPFYLYHVFTTVPVALQAIISYSLLVSSVLWQRKQGLISLHESYHLFVKELFRAIVVGGWTCLAIGYAPAVVSNFFLCLLVCFFAYMVSDVVYNIFAHAVMRLVLIPKYGRVWLLGPSEPVQKEKAS